MIKFNDFYNLATSSHAGTYVVDGADNLRLGSNGAVPTVRVHDTLLRSLAEVKDTSLAVRHVIAEIDELKTQNIPISTRDVRKWQREMQSYISFGAECVSGIQVKENTGETISSNHALSSAVTELDWGRDQDGATVQEYKDHLDLAYSRFAFAVGHPPEEQNPKDYNDRVLTLSGKLIAGSRLGKDPGDLSKDYEELVKVLGSCKAGSGLSREVLGLASEAIDVYTVKLATDHSFFERDLLVVKTRAYLGLESSRNPKNNPVVQLLQLKYAIKNKYGAMNVPDDVYKLEAERTHAEGVPRVNLHVRCSADALLRYHAKTLLEERHRGKWKKIRDFFYPRGAVKEEQRVANELRKLYEEGKITNPEFLKEYEEALPEQDPRGKWEKARDFFYPYGAIKEKQRVTNELRRLCEESGMYDPEFLKEYWDDAYRWSAVRGKAFVPSSPADRDPFLRMRYDTMIMRTGKKQESSRVGRKIANDRELHGFEGMDDHGELGRFRRGLRKLVLRMEFTKPARPSFRDGQEIRRSGWFGWDDVRSSAKPWKLSEVDAVLNNLEVLAAKTKKRTEAYRELVEREEEPAFPSEKSQHSQGFSVPELLTRGQVGIPELDSGACLYTLGGDTFLLSPDDVEEIAEQIHTVVQKNEDEFNADKEGGFYLKEREQEFFSGQRSHRLREQCGEEALKISHSYALKKMYNHWLAFGSHKSPEYALDRANELRRGEKLDYRKLRVLGGVEISVYDEPYYGEFKKALREQLEEIPGEGLAGASKVLEVLRNEPPPYSAEKVFGKIYDDKVNMAVYNALKRVKRMAYAGKAGEFSEQVRAEAKVGSTEYATDREARMKLYLAELPPEVVNSSTFKECISAQLPREVRVNADQYDEGRPLSDRLRSMMFTHGKAVQIATECEEQRISQRREADSDKFLAKSITVDEVLSIQRDVRKLCVGYTEADRVEEMRTGRLAPHSVILDKMKPEVQNINEDMDTVRNSIAGLFDHVWEPTSEIRPAFPLPTPEDGGVEFRVPSPEAPPVAPQDQRAWGSAPEIRPVFSPLTPEADLNESQPSLERSLGVSSEMEEPLVVSRVQTPVLPALPPRGVEPRPVFSPLTSEADLNGSQSSLEGSRRELLSEMEEPLVGSRATSPEIRPVTPQWPENDHLSMVASEGSQELDAHSMGEPGRPLTPQGERRLSGAALVEPEDPLAEDGNYVNSLKNDLLALKFFLGLPKSVSGDLPESKRDAIRYLVDVGDVMFPGELSEAEQWSGEASQGVDAPRVKVALDVAKFYTSNIYKARYESGEITVLPNGDMKTFDEAMRRRPASMDIENVKPEDVAGTRLSGSKVGEAAWGAVTDLVSAEAKIYVRQFFEGSPGGLRTGIDDSELARHVEQLKVFMDARSLNNTPPTHRDIQRQLQKQVGVLPGAHSLDVGLSQMLPMASPKVNFAEFQKKYYLPELGRLQEHASQDPALKAAKASRLNPSDEELKLCFSRVLPLAIVAAEREAQYAQAKEIDPVNRDQTIRNFVGRVIWSRYVRENEVARV